MSSVSRLAIRSKVLTCHLRTKSPILGAAALALVLASGSVAQAQCTSAGFNKPPPAWTNAAAAAVAGVSASVGSLVSSINTVNTAFLTQSTAFIGSPANPRPDQEGGGVWGRGVGGDPTGTTWLAFLRTFRGPHSFRQWDSTCASIEIQRPLRSSSASRGGL